VITFFRSAHLRAFCCIFLASKCGLRLLLLHLWAPRSGQLDVGFGLTPAMLAFYYILCACSCVRVFGRPCQLTKALDRINKWYSIYSPRHSQFAECARVSCFYFPMVPQIMKFIFRNVMKVIQREMSRKTVAAAAAAASVGRWKLI